MVGLSFFQIGAILPLSSGACRLVNCSIFGPPVRTEGRVIATFDLVSQSQSDIPFGSEQVASRCDLLDDVIMT